MINTNHLPIRRLAVEMLCRPGVESFTEQQLGPAILRALVQSGVDLRNGPGLEQMKQLLVEVRDAACAQLRRRRETAMQPAG